MEFSEKKYFKDLYPTIKDMFNILGRAVVIGSNKSIDFSVLQSKSHGVHGIKHF